MSEGALEAAVLQYLERRDADPSLTPEAFARERPEGADALVRAIHAALDVERLFSSTAPAERRIGPYRLLGELGRGGMGVVHRAERGGREYALKVLPLAPLLGPRMRTRFEREATALARLSHPNIVTVRDSGVHEDVPYLVMDLVEGQPLHLMAASLDVARSIALMRTLACTVHAAHGQGVLHRDLKPQNVIVRPDGTPVLLDFGLSVLEEGSSLTMTGDLLGTPRYMAPEQLTGGTIGVRTDVHALGLILYELVTQRPAHDAAARDAVFDSVRRGRIVAPRTHVPDLPPVLEAVILKAVARDPAERYAEAGLLAEDLERVQGGQPTLARPPRLLHRLSAAARRLPARIRGAVAGAVSASADDRQRASALIDSAIRAWADGERTTAVARLTQASQLDRREPTASLLLAHLTGRALPDGSPAAASAHEALRLLESGEFRRALDVLPAAEGSGVRASLHAAMAGLCAAEAGEPEMAFEELTTAARLLPGSVRIQRTLASVCQRLERFDDAVRAHTRALELSPDSADGWADLAEVHVQRRAIDEGLAAIHRAQALSPGEHPRMLRIHGTLEIHRGRQAEAQRLLARALDLDPDDVETLYRMAYSLDSDHDMAEAATLYVRVLERSPAHVNALICLANLHSGASCGQCRKCDEFYAAHPRHLDLMLAEGYLLRAIEADRGASDWATRTARTIAERLSDRSHVIALLERLTRNSPRTPAVLRLEGALHRLEMTAN